MRYSILILIACFGFLYAQPVQPDTSVVSGTSDTLPHSDSLSTGADSRTTKSPVKAALLSLVIPGAGQFYTGRYIKGSVILTSEVILGAFTYDRYQNYTLQRDAAQMFSDSLAVHRNTITVHPDTISRTQGDTIVQDTTFVGIHYDMMYQYAQFLETKSRNLVNQSLVWGLSFYYFNVLDALKNTGYFDDTGTRSPSKAALLSAIPFLGLGQLYNGELSKSGLIFMAQLSVAYMAYNNNTLMGICEKNITKIESKGSAENRDIDAARLDRLWNSAHSEAFKSRNTYIWYSVVLYLYGIVDAVVDAHLHDFPAKMQLEPDLVPEKGQVGMKVRYNF
jgi:TM2 domain-containing membrane protein YozV